MLPGYFLYTPHKDDENEEPDNRISVAVFTLVFVPVLATVAIACYCACQKSGSDVDFKANIFNQEIVSLPCEHSFTKEDGLEVKLPDLKFPRNKLFLYPDKVLGKCME